MPGRIQNPTVDVSHAQPEMHSEHERSNRNIQRKEALSLKLALGSILAPKRPFTPTNSHSMSHTSSGSASPAPSPQPPHPTPSVMMHSRHHHHHPPSRLGMLDPSEFRWPSGSPVDSPDLLSAATAASSAANSPCHGPNVTESHADHPPPLTLPDALLSSNSRSDPIHGLTAGTKPLDTQKPTEVAKIKPLSHSSSPPVCDSGSRTPKARFIEKLESKSAWDALIHGSFS